ncbi:HAD domain-containing protein [Nonomuraea sp. NPDC048826]|uniref:HAD domain-containing protein n=1 Tax=Nonomuraea sp. NPDC048826 TaxID=3364347 RepID=UPI003723CEB9
MPHRPLLFLDVDGPLIPFGAPEPRSFGPPGANPLLARIDPGHGPRLAALPCELVWATTWMADANEVIAPLLGLPELPVVDWPDEEEDGPLHWKTRGLVGWAAGRPFAWVDDEITGADRAWVSRHHPGPALLHRVDPRHGLTAADYAAVSDWLARL